MDTMPNKPLMRTVSRYSLSQYSMGVLFLMPCFILFTLFSWRPIIMSFILSFQKDDGTAGDTAKRFVGWENFRVIFDDPLFYQSWRNTVLFVVFGLIVGYIVPVILAVTINELRHLKNYTRLGYYLPVILPLVVVTIMWKFLYTPNEGFFDSVVKMMGFNPVRWLQNDKTAVLSLVIMSTWKNAGGAMIIYLAALQSVPPQYYEAAEIDGANIWQRLTNVTIPHIIPIMLIMLILQVIGTFQVFVEPFIMTDGGPNNKTLTVLFYLYRQAFKYIDFGVASAVGLTLFIILVALTVVYFNVQKRFEK